MSPTPKPTHQCPAQRCEVRVPQDQLACRRHWVKLPWRLRTNLNEAWRLNDYTGHMVALKAAMDWYAENDVDAAPESHGGHTTTSLDA